MNGALRAPACLVLLAFTACWPLRSQRYALYHEFDRPEERLRSAVYPITMAEQSHKRPQALRIAIDIDAPKDSAVVVVTRAGVPLSELRTLFGPTMHSLEWHWQDQGIESAPPIVEFRERDGRGRSVLESLQLESITPRGLNKKEHFGSISRDSLQSATKRARIIVVRPGSRITLTMNAVLKPQGHQEDSRYLAHYEWITLQAPASTVFRCGEFLQEGVFTVNQDSTCGTASDFPRARDIEARTKMYVPNVWYISGFVSVVTITFAVIARAF